MQQQQQKTTPFSKRRKPNVYYDEDRGFTLKRRKDKDRGQKHLYDYVEITGWIKAPVPIDDYDREIGGFYEIECEGDSPLEVFMGISRIGDLRQLEYLVLSLMGYGANEMPELLNAKGVGEVRQIGSGLMDSLQGPSAFSL